MKQIIYSALIGTLALAMSAQAANDKGAKKKARGGRGAQSAQKAMPQAKAPAQANSSRRANAGNIQRKAVKRPQINTAVARRSQPKRNDAAALRQRTVNQQAAQRKNTKIQQQNANRVDVQNTVNRQQRVTTNRQRKVAITNNWRGSRFNGEKYSAFRNYRRERHDRNWYTSRYNRIVIFGGGNYYWNSGYWYPAWGYDSGANYIYDGPIYGYNDLEPRQVVLNVQERLQREGYYTGALDGLLGPMTREAIAGYQADRGLAITSAIDQPTLATLGLV